jgi:electron transfer flavoprotein alpha subunit
MINKHIIITEDDNISILKSTYSAISAVNKLTKNVTVLILAKDEQTCLNLSKDIKKFVNNIQYIYDKSFENPLSQSYAEAISHVSESKGFDYIWAGSSSFIKETMPRVSARLSNSSMTF